jgi:hypothetical protein
MKYTKEEVSESRAKLLAILKPGDTVQCVLRNCSRSGMSRSIDLFVVRGGELQQVTYWASRVLGDSIDRNNGGIKVPGCGMDMGFHLVYSLSRVLFRDGFAPMEIGIRPSDGKSVNINIGRGNNAGPLTRAEIEAKTAKGWTFPGGRNGDTSGWDSDGGYALRHRWV